MLMPDILRLIKQTNFNSIKLYQVFNTPSIYDKRIEKYVLCLPSRIIPLNYEQFSFLTSAFCPFIHFDWMWQFENSKIYLQKHDMHKDLLEIKLDGFIKSINNWESYTNNLYWENVYYG